jgi:hypothetical protein
MASSPSLSRGANRLLLSIGLATAVAALSGCYVVPMNPAPGQPGYVAPAVQATVQVAPPAPVVFTARLYPANDQAVRHGMVGGVVTNDLNGRGTFNANIQGESFVGEATRKAGSSREGLASGAGNRGSYLSCQYTMNSATLGTGTCRLSDGAQFTMHVGQ